jgi:cysteine desulfurase/selenocysteine lyase
MTTNPNTNNPVPDAPGFPLEPGARPDPAWLARLANELFRTLPDGSSPAGPAPSSLTAADPRARPGRSGWPGVSPVSVAPATPDLRAGAQPHAGAVPPVSAFDPATAGARRAPYFLDGNLPASPRTAATPNLETLDLGLGLPPDWNLAETAATGLAVPGSLPAGPSGLTSAVAAAESAVPAMGESSGLSFYFLDERHALAAPPAADPAAAVGRGPEELGRASAHPGFDIDGVRRDFPILEERVHGRPLIWLDNAATTQKPQAVIDRLARFYRHENSNIHRAAHELAARSTDAYEGAREKVRRFLNASSAREIVFVRGATEGINLIAQSWGRRHVGPGDEIVITWLEHHANIVPWQQLCAATGARLRVAPVDDSGQILLDEYEKLFGARTRLAAFSQVSNALGTVTPVREMVEIAHRHGARVLVDGAQAVSHLRVDVQALDCDWYVFSGHKVFGPTGIGVVFGKADLLDETPPWQGGGNMIADVTFEKTLYQPAPARFEAGTGNIADAVGLGAALDYLERVGLENVARYEHELLDYATGALLEIPGLCLIGTAREKAGVISFVLDGFRPEEVGKALDREGIAVRSGHHCAQPILRRFGQESTVRPSLALYNTTGEIDALVEAVKRIRSGRYGLRR